MTEKPILFNTSMVRAIIDGRKTQTRRIVKGYIPEDAVFGYDMFTRANGNKVIACRGTFTNGYGERLIKHPYQIGDLLWVRETWAYNRDRWLYRADYPDSDDFSWVKWRPSIHMPRKAARIFLKVTNSVRAERLQNIDAWDILAEGVTCDTDAAWCDIVRLKYRELWDRTIKPADRDRYGWSANPWVWVIQFKKAEGR